MSGDAIETARSLGERIGPVVAEERARLMAERDAARADVERMLGRMVDFGARLSVKVKVVDGDSFSELVMVIDEMRDLLSELGPKYSVKHIDNARKMLREEKTP